MSSFSCQPEALGLWKFILRRGYFSTVTAENKKELSVSDIEIMILHQDNGLEKSPLSRIELEKFRLWCLLWKTKLLLIKARDGAWYPKEKEPMRPESLNSPPLGPEDYKVRWVLTYLSPHLPSDFWS